MQIAEKVDAGVHNRGTGETEAPRASIVLVSRIERFGPCHAMGSAYKVVRRHQESRGPMESDWGVHR